MCTKRGPAEPKSDSTRRVWDTWASESRQGEAVTRGGPSVDGSTRVALWFSDTGAAFGSILAFMSVSRSLEHWKKKTINTINFFQYPIAFF